MTQERALSILKTGANVFLTGEPGAGKTHTINTYVDYLRQYGVEPAITASTGIAATHISGVTIHSWSGIGIKNTLSPYDLDRISTNEHVAKRINRSKVLIIDEISMLSPATLSMVDAVCREVKHSVEAFGGLQVVFVGDFFQLPPIVKNEPKNEYEEFTQMEFEQEVVKRFSYDSPAWSRAKPIVCYLSEQHRQDDVDFLTILSAIRGNNFEEVHLSRLATRKIEIAHAPKDAPKLFSHNVDVDGLNTKTLSLLTSDVKKFEMSHQGREALVLALKRGCLSPELLCLKVGAKVMFTKNNTKEGFVNGTLGEVQGFNKLDGMPIIKTKKGRIIKATPMDWTIEEGGEIKASINQIPLRLAWAITVHKSQGMSLDEAVMDLSDVFEFGQGYVALSRVRRLSGLYILGWNKKTFEVHPEVLEKDLAFHESSHAVEIAFDEMKQGELESMHKNFITSVGGKFSGTSYKKMSQKLRGKGFDSVAETYMMVKEGKTILEVARLRNLTEGTILSHLERHTAKGAVSKDAIVHVILGIEKEIEAITKELKKDKTGTLRPVFDALGGKYPFERIRLAKLFLH